jgi:acetate kinase
MADNTLLTLNTGSSSLKLTAYDAGLRPRLKATVERVGGAAAGQLRVVDGAGGVVAEHRAVFEDHAAALAALMAPLREHAPPVAAVGHRIVHGGARFVAPVAVTDEVVDALDALTHLAPDHMPGAVAALRAAREAYPRVPHVACFDTAFHQPMPRLAHLLPVPRRLQERGLVRYGFHGLSYEAILENLRATDPGAAVGRVVVAHLGSGASMAAIHRGQPMDTTMGFTPAGGLMMGTRTGDLDPGVLLHLMVAEGMDRDAVDRCINREAGLLGVSGRSADVRDLLAFGATDPAAAEALALYCYQARKHLGALVATLGGLDTLVFTGGVGEHAAPVRARICDGLAFMGVYIDGQRNAAGAAVISADAAPVTVRVMATHEDLMIARHTRALTQRSTP